MKNYAYVTVINSLDYLDGARTLLYSLKKVNSQYPVMIVTPKGFDASAQSKIERWGGTVLEAEAVGLGNLAEKNPRAYWNETFLKLRIFDLVSYDKLVYIDADMIVLENLDHLFERKHISAVQGGKLIFGWEDINSGLMVIEPNRKEYEEMVSLIPLVCERKIEENTGFGDQDVISYYYKNINRKWEEENRLDERYNAMIRCIHELCVHYGYENLKVIHFVGERKPWMFSLAEIARYVVHYTLHHERYRAMCALKYYGYVQKARRKLR